MRRIKKLLSSISSFAKRRPSLFVVIVMVGFFGFLYGTYLTLHVTSTAKFCGLCHVMEETGAGAEYNTWKETMHAQVDVSCIDCHGDPGFFGYMRAKIGGLKDVYGEITTTREEKMAFLNKPIDNLSYAINLMPSDRCAYCHTTEVNQQVRDNTIMSFFGFHMRSMDKIENPEFLNKMGMVDIYSGDQGLGINPKHATHMKVVGLSCLNCHSKVSHPDKPGEILSIKMEDCFTCHDQEREKAKFTKMPANTDCATCHTDVVALQEGTSASKLGIDNQTWMMPSVTCDSCHYEAREAPVVQSCVDCHDDSYAEMYTMFRDDYDAKMVELETASTSLLSLKDEMNDEQAIEYRRFVLLTKIARGSSKSKSMHNTYYLYDIIDNALIIATDIETQINGIKA